MTDRIDLSPADVPIGRVLPLQSISTTHWSTDDSNRIRMVIRTAKFLAVAVAVPFVVLVGTFLWSRFFVRTHSEPSSSESISTVLPRWSPGTDQEVGRDHRTFWKRNP